MSRETLITKIKKLQDDMKEETLEAGVPKIIFDATTNKIDLYTDEELTELYSWLATTEKHEFDSILKIRRMVAPHAWHNYKVFEIQGLREQELLKEAQEKLMDHWKKPYRPKRRVKRRKHVTKEPNTSNLT